MDRKEISKYNFVWGSVVGRDLHNEFCTISWNVVRSSEISFVILQKSINNQTNIEGPAKLDLHTSSKDDFDVEVSEGRVNFTIRSYRTVNRYGWKRWTEVKIRFVEEGNGTWVLDDYQANWEIDRVPWFRFHSQCTVHR